MNTKNMRKIGLMALVGALIGLSGCATTEQVDNLQSQIDSLKADVASARSEAASVSAKADDAIETSNIAVSVANEANRRSIETESKIDRMFKKAMYK